MDIDSLTCKNCGLIAELTLGQSCLGMVDTIYFHCPRCNHEISYREKKIVEDIRWLDNNLPKDSN